VVRWEGVHDELHGCSPVGVDRLLLLKLVVGGVRYRDQTGPPAPTYTHSSRASIRCCLQELRAEGHLAADKVHGILAECKMITQMLPHWFVSLEPRAASQI
jgi:hypothetical protein